MHIIIRTRPPLCEGCHHGAVFTRASIGGPLVACRWLNRILLADVQTCTRYQPMGTLPLDALRAEPLIIDPRPAPPSAERAYT